MRIIPKVGPLSVLAFKPPTPEMETLFQQSVTATRERYGLLVQTGEAGVLTVPNRDFDTGKPTVMGEYSLADEAYAQLVDKLADREFADTPVALRDDILRFYSGSSNKSHVRKKDREHWEKTQQQVERLRQMTAQNRLKAASFLAV